MFRARLVARLSEANKFDFSGELGGCAVQLGLSYSRDLASADDPTRGGCTGTSASCYGPAGGRPDAASDCAGGCSTLGIDEVGTNAFSSVDQT
jgi:hypothetical protein